MSAPKPTEYAAFRVYSQGGGRYKAVGVVERPGEDGRAVPKHGESGEHDSAGAALAEVLQATGFLS